MRGPLILAIDPGSAQSAWVLYYEGRPTGFGIDDNAALCGRIRECRWNGLRPSVLVIEKIESYGMAVGREVFDTVHWSGRFTEAFYPLPVVAMPRREVKLALCGNARAKDANIRQAVLDRFGGSAAKGTKARPGPLYGVSKDVWSAVAIAVTYTGEPKA